MCQYVSNIFQIAEESSFGRTSAGDVAESVASGSGETEPLAYLMSSSAIFAAT